MQLTNTFPAIGTDGRDYTVHVYTVVGSNRILETADGLNINYRKKGEYQVVQTGVILRTQVPNAP